MLNWLLHMIIYFVHTEEMSVSQQNIISGHQTRIKAPFFAQCTGNFTDHCYFHWAVEKQPCTNLLVYKASPPTLSWVNFLMIWWFEATSTSKLRRPRIQSPDKIIFAVWTQHHSCDTVLYLLVSFVTHFFFLNGM